MPSSPLPSSSIPQLKILRAYAKLADASLSTTLPPTIYFSHTRHTLTIFDAYPKALFHFLVLPRCLRRIAATTTTSSTSEDERRERDEGVEEEEEEEEVEVLVADRTEDLTNLRTLLLLLQQRTADPAGARARAKGTLSVLSDEATRLQSQIEREMQTHYGFKWPIWIGFHAIPSMEYVHPYPP